jgi:hypothetical protein
MKVDLQAVMDEFWQNRAEAAEAEANRLRVLLGWAEPMLAEASRMLTANDAYNPDPLVEQIARFRREPKIAALGEERS